MLKIRAMVSMKLCREYTDQICELQVVFALFLD
jgi:hypothetical protein